MNLRLLCSILALILGVLDARVLSFDELKDKPKSLAKDYYINRLINEVGVSKEQAKILSTQLYRNGGGVKKSLDKILPKAKQIGVCDRFGLKNILDANLSCQNTLTTINFSLKLDDKTRQILALNLQKIYPKKSQILLALNRADKLNAMVEINATNEFIALLKDSDRAIDLTPNFMDMLYKSKGFSTLLNSTIFERKFENFRSNFLKIDPKITEKNDAFLLGLNAIILKQNGLASEFFKQASLTFSYQSQRDNAKFWLYLLGQKQVLNELANSTDINIYSLYAKELLNAKPFEIYVPSPSVKNANEPDITDPFTWQILANKADSLSKDELIKLASKFYTKDSVSAYVYFMQKAVGWGKNYYIIPQNEALDDINATRKSLIFALARQESLFLPSVVSTSYALGTMQFMPFLANAIGKKELKIENFDETMMFKPNVAYKFANHHLNYLEKFISHPLFIAYAYNGGIGFTKRLLKRDDMFKGGEFEPFLSMELVPYTETRNYGKKVLSNYVVYNALMGSNIKISQLLQILNEHRSGHRF